MSASRRHKNNRNAAHADVRRRSPATRRRCAVKDHDAADLGRNQDLVALRAPEPRAHPGLRQPIAVVSNKSNTLTPLASACSMHNETVFSSQLMRVASGPVPSPTTENVSPSPFRAFMRRVFMFPRECPVVPASAGDTSGGTFHDRKSNARRNRIEGFRNCHSDPDLCVARIAAPRARKACTSLRTEEATDTL